MVTFTPRPLETYYPLKECRSDRFGKEINFVPTRIGTCCLVGWMVGWWVGALVNWLVVGRMIVWWVGLLDGGGWV